MSKHTSSWTISPPNHNREKVTHIFCGTKENSSKGGGAGRERAELTAVRKGKDRRGTEVSGSPGAGSFGEM